MDLNSAIHEAQVRGARVRDDATMRPGWIIRWDPADQLLYYFRPNGEKAHKVVFSDAMRASPQWRLET
jgi:hypothetical protein